QQLDGVLGEGNVAHTAMSGNGTTSGDDPLQTAVWRLRSRACWADAAALLPPAEPAAALQRASLLVERCLYTEAGWEEAEDALRTAEALADTDDERGAAACERGYLAYAATLFQVRDRADEARAALGRAAALIAPGAAGRPLPDFRRGLIAENPTRSPQRHLAGLALREGELVEARQGFAESLRIREELGYLVGTAPALVSLADTETEAEASRLREEARRLFRLLGGVPTWLARQLAPPAAG